MSRAEGHEPTPAAGPPTLTSTSARIGEFPKIRGTILGVPILRIIVFWGLYLGFPCFLVAFLSIGLPLWL